MEWSFRLLSQDQQTLLARLGVFVGGATLEAIGAVALRAFDDDPDVLELLAGLVDASFVKAIEDPDGEPRFVLLETIRVFALEQLAASGEIDATYDDHARHLYRVMQRLRTQRDEDFSSFVPAVMAELGNIGVVVDRLLSGHIPDEIAPLGRRWHAAELAIAVTANSGSLVMAYTWGLRFVDAFARIAAPPAPMEVLSRAMCLARVAWLARALEQQDVARRTADMAVHLSHEAASGLPDSVTEDGADGLPAVTMVALGAELWAALDREDFEVARRAAVGLSRLSPLLAPGLRSAALSWTADAGIVTKDFGTALRALEAGQDALRDEGSPDYSRACWEYQRAAVDAYRGEGDAALARARACLDLVVSLDEPVLLDGLGEVVMVAIGAVEPRASARIEGALGAFRDRTPGTASEAFTRLVEELMGPVRRRLTDAEWAAEMAGSAEVPLEQALRQALGTPASAPTPA